MTAFRLLLATAATLAVGAAQAAPVTYSSRAAFNAALAGLGASATTQTFESIDPAFRGTNLPDQNPGASFGYTIGGLTLTSPRAFGVQFVNGSTQLFTGFSAGSAAGGTLTFTLPSPSIAFGIDLVDYQSILTEGTDPLTVAGLGVSQLLDTQPTQAAPTFFGVIDASATTGSFSISRSTRVLYPLTFDNVTFAAAPATAVPEPASALLAALGMGLMVALRRRAG